MRSFLLRVRSGGLVGHPWRALLLILALHPVWHALVGLILHGLLRLPRVPSNEAAAGTVALLTVGGFLAYVITPFLLRVPGGRRTFRQYLADIRLTRARPFVPLLILTISCLAILCLCQGAGSLVYRWTEGKPLTREFIGRVFDLSAVVRPHWSRLFVVFYSGFEEVVFRGVLLTMLLASCSPRRAILYSALAFGLLHLPAVLAGRALVSTLAQVVWASLFGLFYGYLFVRSGSLIPPMIVHWLANTFQAPLTAYWLAASPGVRALYGVVFGYGLATPLLLLWVRAFSARWLDERHPSAVTP